MCLCLPNVVLAWVSLGVFVTGGVAAPYGDLLFGWSNWDFIGSNEWNTGQDVKI